METFKMSEQELLSAYNKMKEVKEKHPEAVLSYTDGQVIVTYSFDTDWNAF
jgi:hypothetical protein